MHKLLRSLLILNLLAVSSACQAMPPAGNASQQPIPREQVYSHSKTDVQPVALTVRKNALNQHLDFIDQLYQMNTESLDKAYDESLAAFSKDSNLNNQLRLAWVLGAHGHAHSNPWAARKHLFDALRRLDEEDDVSKLVRIQIIQLGRTIQLYEAAQQSQEKLKALTDIEQHLEKKNSQEVMP